MQTTESRNSSIGQTLSAGTACRPNSFISLPKLHWNRKQSSNARFTVCTSCCAVDQRWEQFFWQCFSRFNCIVTCTWCGTRSSWWSSVLAMMLALLKVVFSSQHHVCCEPRTWTLQMCISLNSQLKTQAIIIYWHSGCFTMAWSSHVTVIQQAKQAQTLLFICLMIDCIAGINQHWAWKCNHAFFCHCCCEKWFFQTM